jgi:hypothetical protein
VQPEAKEAKKKPKDGYVPSIYFERNPTKAMRNAHYSVLSTQYSVPYYLVCTRAKEKKKKKKEGRGD